MSLIINNNLTASGAAKTFTCLQNKKKPPGEQAD